MTNCPNCGAPVDGSGRCGYCGTAFSHTTTIHVNVRKPSQEEIIDRVTKNIILQRREFDAMLERSENRCKEARRRSNVI